MKKRFIGGMFFDLGHSFGIGLRGKHGYAITFQLPFGVPRFIYKRLKFMIRF